MTHVVVKITPRGRVDLYCGPSAAEADKIMHETITGKGERLAYGMMRF